MRGSLSTRNDSNSEYRPKLYDPYYTKEEMMEQYFRLCRGERLRPLEWEKGLKCVYFTGHNPYFLINPMKMEVVNDDPFITIFYNAIMDNEIEHFLNMSGQKLEPAKQFSNNGTSFTSSGRISDNTWISSSATNITAGLSKRLGRLLGLDITENDGSAEEYQVNSYAANGVYKPHHDYFLEEMTEKYQYRGHKPGNRIATFMYYLSDVPAGGATVFPTIGATIWPKKGSAVFWWNLKRDMSTDPLTLHGACPVLYGSKWVMNLWIHSFSQIFIKKCSIKREEYFTSV